MDGVVNGDPVPMAMPPVATSYHLSVPVHPEAVRPTVPGPHLEAPLPAGAAGIGFIVAITGTLKLSHPELFVQDT